MLGALLFERLGALHPKGGQGRNRSPPGYYGWCTGKIRDCMDHGFDLHGRMVVEDPLKLDDRQNICIKEPWI